MHERLRRKGFDPVDVQATLNRLIEAGYINDEGLSRELARKAREVKLLGARGASMYLRKMGIPSGTARAALDGYDEAGSAEKLLRSKLRSVQGLEPRVARRRMAGYLARRGYSAATARRAMEEAGVFGYDNRPGGGRRH